MTPARHEQFFAGLVAVAARDPEKVAIDDAAGSALTYSDLVKRVDDAATAIHEAGWTRVALRADNGVDWIIADLALLALGVTCVPLPTFFTDEQCAHVIRSTGLEGLLVSRDDLATTGVPIERARVRCARLSAWRIVGAQPTAPSPWAKVTFTSGTTGTPKDVALTAETLLATADALACATHARSDDVHLCALPLSVLLENVGGVYRTLASGGTVVVPTARAVGIEGSSEVDGHRLVDVLEHALATVVILVPAMLEALVDELETSGRRLPHLRVVGVGGAPVAPALLDRAWDVRVPAYQGYGLSEAASVVALEQPFGGRRRGTVGRAVGRTVRVAADGELIVERVRGVGRLAEPADAEHVTTLHTGDLGDIDDDGFITVYGRKRDVIVTSFGRNVSPSWVESLLVGGVVRQAAVFGHGRAHLEALLVVDPQTSHDAIEAVVARANAALPDYARVGAWVVAPVPFSQADGCLTPSGSPARARIAQLYDVQLAALRDSKHPPHEESMMTPPSFYDVLLSETASRQRELFEVPFVAAAVTGALTLDEYVAFLEQAYHHVRHTVPLLRATKQALPNRLAWLADELDRYIDEEIGHEEWILSDIAECGADSEAVRNGKPDAACTAMVEHAYGLIHGGRPLGFFGMVHVLEGTSVRGATRAAEMLEQSLGLPRAAFTYLTTHGDVDIDHVDFFESLMNRIDDARDQREVLEAAQRFFDLYGDIFRGLDAGMASTPSN